MEAPGDDDGAGDPRRRNRLSAVDVAGAGGEAGGEGGEAVGFAEEEAGECGDVAGGVEGAGEGVAGAEWKDAEGEGGGGRARGVRVYCIVDTGVSREEEDGLRAARGGEGADGFGD